MIAQLFSGVYGGLTLMANPCMLTSASCVHAWPWELGHQRSVARAVSSCASHARGHGLVPDKSSIIHVSSQQVHCTTTKHDIAKTS